MNAIAIPFRKSIPSLRFKIENDELDFRHSAAALLIHFAMKNNPATRAASVRAVNLNFEA